MTKVKHPNKGHTPNKGQKPSGVGSNRVLQGPPIQVVGVALITEFCDHNFYFIEVIILI